MLLHDLPALALVLFIARGSLVFDPFQSPKRPDAVYAIGAFIALILISAATGFAASFFPGNRIMPYLEAPTDPAGWAAAIASCAVTGYLEESFFRAYLLTKMESLGVTAAKSIALSVALFSLCHSYEGPWGLVNAALAGSALSIVFLRRRSVHAAAWAHAAYNSFVYLTYR
jgi:membrane protease YdiL (CAAX protease family)